MKCPRCKSAMKEMKRSFHKKRKWVCPKCGRIRFQDVKRRLGGPPFAVGSSVRGGHPRPQRQL